MTVLKRLRPSPAMVVAFLSLIVSVSGVAYAASKVDTSDIKNKSFARKMVTTDENLVVTDTDGYRPIAEFN